MVSSLELLVMWLPLMMASITPKQNQVDDLF